MKQEDARILCLRCIGPGDGVLLDVPLPDFLETSRRVSRREGTEGRLFARLGQYGRTDA